RVEEVVQAAAEIGVVAGKSAVGQVRRAAAFIVQSAAPGAAAAVLGGVAADRAVGQADRAVVDQSAAQSQLTRGVAADRAPCQRERCPLLVGQSAAATDAGRSGCVCGNRAVDQGGDASVVHAATVADGGIGADRAIQQAHPASVVQTAA